MDDRRRSTHCTAHEGDQLGQGKEHARAFLRDDPDLAEEAEKRLKDKLGIGARMAAPADDDIVDLSGLPEPGPLNL